MLAGYWTNVDITKEKQDFGANRKSIEEVCFGVGKCGNQLEILRLRSG